MTATKPLAPHGTRARYRRGCRKECCLAADRRDRKRRKLYGSLKTQPDTIIPHLRELLDGGASVKSVAKAAGCDRTTVQRILNGTRKGVWQSTRDRILAAADAELTANIPALCATRQVRALIAAKHPLSAIIAASGLDRSLVSELANGRRNSIRASTAVAIRNVYGQLSDSVGASSRSANRATREGWAPPAAWDGIDMSDPKAFPDFTGHCGSTSGYWIHRSRGIPQCQPCRDAESEANAERRAKRAAGVRRVSA
ncbi:hypothetical protein Caci_3035 [Catenulispora acidiphila DSM 44928]|uniref:Uncharacterized protein n=1 Tax=Catenulispora acidiphila (strain DSM 44928 / JCM 14897 / NBRC 102108 / NRRL B-24433 / ID139908) TaxID=479433 RepID=C7Q4H5_CATAD|nr:LacI family DNA-binding transcriptional regulator [Catenulispora acidiphila]ACU71944.1 hypothetical protein Caci_3035 [Catenulispora acidiphila DSM 44928]